RATSARTLPRDVKAVELFISFLDQWVERGETGRPNDSWSTLALDSRRGQNRSCRTYRAGAFTHEDSHAFALDADLGSASGRGSRHRLDDGRQRTRAATAAGAASARRLLVGTGGQPGSRIAPAGRAGLCECLRSDHQGEGRSRGGQGQERA